MGLNTKKNAQTQDYRDAKADFGESTLAAHLCPTLL